MSTSDRKQATRSETAENLNAEEGNASQYLIDLPTPLAVRMRAMEDFLAGGGHPSPPPPEQLIVSMAALIAPTNEQENCMRNFGSLQLVSELKMLTSGRKRTTRSETAEYLNAEEGNAPQYLIDLLTPLTAMMGTIEDFLAGGGHPPPPPPKQSVFPMAAVIAPANEQENSMRNFGILSDCIPIRRKKRKPYLVIATILSLLPWLVLGLTSLRSSRNFLMASLTVQNVGAAMADVVIDAMIAEAVRAEKAEFSGDLQSLSWSAMALGGICGSLLGGYTLSTFRIDTIFLLFSLLPIVQLLSCTCIEEVPSEASKMDQNGQENMHSESDSIPSNSFVDTSKNQTTRRRKSSHKKGKKKKISLKYQITAQQHSSLAARWRESLKSAIFSLCRAFRQPIILRPMAWFFFSHIAVPNLSTVMFYYRTEVLHFEASFLGTARVMGWFGLIIGTYAYNRYLKRMKLRRILMFAHVGLAIMNLLDIVLVAQLNIQLGIPDKYMVLGGSAVGDTINQFKLMPFLILSGQLCPPGIEGTLFALFMSINNLGSTLGSFFGAALASVLDISSGSYQNLLYGLIVQLFCTIIPIGFLFLIPEEATGLTSQ